MAIAFKLAQTQQFKQFQSQTIKNCKDFTNRLRDRGFKIAFNGTNTHLMNLDMKSVVGNDGAYLSGDLAARILDIAGIVTNRNTIPGDRSALRPTGVRMGTHWITQRGFDKTKSEQLADIIGDILFSSKPYFQGKALRTKVDFEILEQSKIKVRDMALDLGIDFFPGDTRYPHFYYFDDEYENRWISFRIGGEKIRQFLNTVLSSDVESLQEGQKQATKVFTPKGGVEGYLTCVNSLEFHLSVPGKWANIVVTWLRDLSDGYVFFDDDLLRKVPGPIWVKSVSEQYGMETSNDPISNSKPYFIGITENKDAPLPDFEWKEQDIQLKRTPLFDIHLELGAKMVPFAGWEMPVRYSSVLEEHRAVREAAGLFDVTHMGVYQMEGPDAVVFLDSVCSNDISALKQGQSLYTQFLDPNADVIDDLLVYRRGKMKYLIVGNASNDNKNWEWLNAVRDGKVKVDRSRPWTRAFGRSVIIRNLKEPKEKSDMLVTLALQGSRSRDILLSLGLKPGDRQDLIKLQRTELCELKIGDFDLIVSRTGFTGEKLGYELFIHPDDVGELFKKLLEVGEPFGLKPIGLGARDSLRTEAGLPLYGHEMGGDLNLGVSEAGFGSSVKTYKPWFIGREAFIERDNKRKGEVIRFRFNEKVVRMAHSGDPVLDKRGKVIGMVTSCSTDQNGHLLGQAFLDLKYKTEGTPIFIYQGAPQKMSKAPADMQIGDRAIIPTAATVIRRLPKLS
jgi:glycine hydroxymethyltransferase